MPEPTPLVHGLFRPALRTLTHLAIERPKTLRLSVCSWQSDPDR